ncbi:MAG: succinate dehydrogenase/fumarate reductase iron-sulfur subunit, partial [Bradymonadaceae bacterium]
MTIHLKVWRQAGPSDKGRFESYTAKGINAHMSFLEMLDVVNETLIKEGKEPIEFDSDCREGICGTCGCMINGQAHGGERGTTVCQLHMRAFSDGQTLVIEPWRAAAFPVIKDLVVDRNAFDRIIAAGGYVSVKAGPKPDANGMRIGKDVSDRAFDSAACIGCGACVAACPNASASLFTSAKITQMSLLPQGHPERARRVRNMVDR